MSEAAWRTPTRKPRRRLVLPPVCPLVTPAAAPAAVSSGSGSRFGLLGEISEAEDEISVAEEVAWQGLVDEPRVPPLDRAAGRGYGDLLADFWTKIGFPTSASRSWEKQTAADPSLMPSASRARSSSPPRPSRLEAGRRPASSSPPGVRLPKPAMRMKAWKGPLPPRRITPPAVLADFIVSSTVGGRGDPPEVEEWVEQRRPSRRRPRRRRRTPLRPSQSARIPLLGLSRMGWPSAPMGATRPRPGQIVHAIAAPSIDFSSQENHAAVFADRESRPCVNDNIRTGPPSSAPSSSSSLRPRPPSSLERSFAEVVVRGNAVAAMVGPSRPRRRWNGCRSRTTARGMFVPHARCPRCSVHGAPRVPRLAGRRSYAVGSSPCSASAGGVSSAAAGAFPAAICTSQIDQTQHCGLTNTPQPGHQPMAQPPVQHMAPQNLPAQQGQLKKRRKKKNAPAVGVVPGGVVAPVPPLVQPAPAPTGMPVMTPAGDSPPWVQLVLLPTVWPWKRIGPCWKCAVNTHATKDCKEDGDDDSHGFEEERDDAGADVTPEIAHMEVDGHPPTHPSGAAAAPVTQVALTPFNHSPMTDRGREIVARARTESPHLVASPTTTSRASSPSRVRTFMQAQTEGQRPGAQQTSSTPVEKQQQMPVSPDTQRPSPTSTVHQHPGLASSVLPQPGVGAQQEAVQTVTPRRASHAAEQSAMQPTSPLRSSLYTSHAAVQPVLQPVMQPDTPLRTPQPRCGDQVAVPTATPTSHQATGGKPRFYLPSTRCTANGERREGYAQEDGAGPTDEDVMQRAMRRKAEKNLDTADMASPINFNQFLEKEKLKSNGSNFTDWFRHVRIFLNGGNLQYVLDAPLGDPPAETETDEVKNVYATRKTRYSQVQCAILCSLESDLQKRFEHHDPHELMKELKTIFETHAAVECYEASKHFFSCMMEEGSSISEHMLAMTGHAKKLSDLGIVIPNRLGINRVLQSLPPSYKNFVMNYNMQNMNKEFPELFGMLKAAEIEIKKEHQVFMVNKTTSFKKQGKSKGKFKKGGKKAATPPMKPKNGPKPDAECYYCKEKGHWKRNCSKYLADLKSGLVKKKKEGISDIHELKNKRRLLKDEVTMRVGNGSKVDVIAVGTLPLHLPSGLVLSLNNCYFVPALSMNIISGSCLMQDGYSFKSENNGCSICMNNIFYGRAPEKNGLFLLDLDSSDTHIHNIDAKRIKLNDNSTYMWHCRLGHIRVKRMKKLHTDGLLESLDFESLDRCEACLMGKMTKTPFSGMMERATDLLEIIHTDVCGPMSVASRGGYRYVLTFTDDLSRYGYIYLMKHKSETFEKFKEFQSEVENQRNKKIKFLRSDRGGEYLSYEFGMHLKKCGILSQLTPPGTPQRNGVSERRNRTLLDMVRSMISEGKIFVAKNGTFLEKEFLTKEVTGRKVELDEIEESLLIDQSSAVPENVPVPPTPATEEANDNDHETSNETATEPRRSTRDRATPDWYDPCLNVMIVDNNDEDPATYEEAMMSPDSNKWQEAMKSEMGSMYDNKVWTLVDLPDSRKAVENKWIFKRKTDADGMEHWTAVKNILKYLKRTKDMFLCYGGDQELVVTSYTDASWNTDPDDSKSQSRVYIEWCRISWASSKQCTVAKSSTESEYIAASSEAVWMKRFIVELGVVPSALDPLVIYCDNMGAIANAQEPRSHKRLKHIKLRYHSIREYIEDGEVKICKVHTDLNVADPLTKALPRAKHDQHQNAMGVRYLTM
ncbi:hypothetical protein QYE76_014470 [Lolium multiflorum]|uniref:Retrotransposon protein, putative, Ty1-copia subclass n=1 Tax=Lolium multiflorum TaxID=4521 RepID=A0AAD8X5I1_LOLMU|nr:hypothetical protein QYE76_014470 [Lolium multiflorum]